MSSEHHLAEQEAQPVWGDSSREMAGKKARMGMGWGGSGDLRGHGKECPWEAWQEPTRGF